MDYIPDVIERKTVVSVIVGIIEEIKFLEISNKKLRLKFDLKPIEGNIIKDTNKLRTNNDMLIGFIKEFYNQKIENNLKDYEFDDKIFAYVSLLAISILEDSTLVILGHQLSIECIPVEQGLQESTTSNILIDKILKSLK